MPGPNKLKKIELSEKEDQELERLVARTLVSVTRGGADGLSVLCLLRLPYDLAQHLWGRDWHDLGRGYVRYRLW